MVLNKTTLFSLKTLLILILASSFSWATVTDSSTTSQSKRLPNSYFENITVSGSSIARVTGLADAYSGSFIFDNPLGSGTKKVRGGTFYGTLDGNAAKFYCIDLGHYIKYYKDEDGKRHEYTDQQSTPAEITYILNNYFPNANPTLSTNLEATAVQVAIWHYSDGVDASSIQEDNNSIMQIKQRALQIIADADANAGTTTPIPTLTIAPISQMVVNGTDAVFIITANDENNNPISGLDISLSTTAGTLTATQVTTNNNGEATVTLQQNGAPNAVVTATATVVVPQGTRYVHTVEPDKWQKLVLATPTNATRNISGQVAWYNNGGGDCELGGFMTFTQGGWGSPSNSTPGQIRDTYFNTVFPNGLTIGGNKTLVLTSAQAVEDFMPSGGTSSYFTSNYTNPTGHTSAGVLASQIVAVTLNVEYDAHGYLGVNSRKLSELLFLGGPFDGMSIADFLVIANDAIGGNQSTGYTYSQINEAATLINENFDNGTVDKGNLTCFTEPCNNKIGDFIWHDTNANGIQDSGEEGIEGVVIALVGNGQNLSATSDANGYYEFTVPNGTYTIQIAQSNFDDGGVLASTKTANQTSDWYITRPNRGSDDTKDSDGDIQTRSAQVTVDCEDNPTIDFGFVKACLIFDKTSDIAQAKEGQTITYNFYVENCGDVKLSGGVSIYDPMFKPDGNHKIFYTKAKPGEKFNTQKTYVVTANDCDTKIVNEAWAIGHPVWTTDETYNTNDGNQGFSQVRVDDTVSVNVVCDEPASLGNKVWYDTNKNGIQDDDEAGVEGVWVSLYDCSGANEVFVKKMQTDNNGIYLFDDLVPSDYSVLFELPNGYKFTSKNAGNDSEKDSDADETTGKTECTTLVSGEVDLSWDAGIYQEFASLGDYVWYDTNKDGIQDVGEEGVKGVLVNLYSCAGNLLATTTTNNDGWYHFDGLTPAEYQVEFVKPAGFEFSPVNQGGDADFDSDADANTGRTVCITLNAGDTDDSWDAGIYEPEPDEADIELTKVVSNENPEDGEVITYTIKVTNKGPKDAENVTVSDVLPGGVVYQSYSTSNNSVYDDQSGVWTVGNLANQAMETLTISVKVDVQDAYTASWDLGPAKGYNLFVLYDVNQPSSDTEGKVAVGRNASFANYSIGDKLNNTNGTEDVLVVGSKLTFTSGRVYNGNVVYGTTTNLPLSLVSIDEGALRKDSPIDFTAARSYLTNLSNQLAAIDVNATTTVESWGEIFLTGNDPYLNVFELNGSDLSNTTSVQIKVPNGAVVLVNISGKNVQWSGGLSITGTSKSNILYNFYQAKKLTINNIDVRGSVLAPKAVLDFASGVVNGQVIAKFVKGAGQFNNILFTGHIPEQTCVTNIAEVTGSSLLDPNSANGSDFAVFCIGTDNGNGGGNNGGGNNGGSNTNNGWEFTGSFGLQEIVYSFCYDVNGYIYAGTYGGKIYVSTDEGQNWTLTNENMQVSVIWNLLAYNGYIFASTEQGVYRYDGATWTLVGLSGIDVRAIAVDVDGNLYAGTWGLGVYKSTDLGLTWNDINTGLGYNLVINSITVTSFNEIVISTVGGGIAVSVNGGVSWDMSNSSFNYGWTLDVTSDGVIYAGTYGEGLHFSTDGGYTWEIASLNLDAKFIYSVSIDIEDNIYVSSFNSGVFVSKDGGVTWEDLGLGGFGVSSLFVNTNDDPSAGNTADNGTNLLLAGTKTGQVYVKSIGEVTSVTKNDNSLPTEFALDQNYPNPFNPTTQIRFSVPQAGQYSLKVYNAIGQEVSTLATGQMSAGNFTVTFDAASLSSGMYIYQLSGNNVKLTKKMILMK